MPLSFSSLPEAARSFFDSKSSNKRSDPSSNYNVNISPSSVSLPCRSSSRSPNLLPRPQISSKPTWPPPPPPIAVHPIHRPSSTPLNSQRDKTTSNTLGNKKADATDKKRFGSELSFLSKSQGNNTGNKYSGYSMGSSENTHQRQFQPFKAEPNTGRVLSESPTRSVKSHGQKIISQPNQNYISNAESSTRQIHCETARPNKGRIQSEQARSIKSQPNYFQPSNIELNTGQIYSEPTRKVEPYINLLISESHQRIKLQPSPLQISSVEPSKGQIHNEPVRTIRSYDNQSSLDISQKKQIHLNQSSSSNIEPRMGRIEHEPAVAGFKNCSSWRPGDNSLHRPPIPPRHDSRRPFQDSKPVPNSESQHHSTLDTRCEKVRGTQSTKGRNVANEVNVTEARIKKDCLCRERSHGKGPKATAKKVIQAKNITHLTLPTTTPETIIVSDLPECFPGDDIGRNANRDEAYADILLNTLKERQHVLIQLLIHLVNTDNMLRKGQHPSAHDFTSNPQLDLEQVERFEAFQPYDSLPRSFNQIQRSQEHENATIEYQRSIIGLWRIDRNMCFWLNRYIRVMRRIRRSLEYMFPILGKPPVTEFHNDIMEESTASTTDEQDLEWDSGGISRPELERMGILMPKIFKCEARNTYRESVESSILPTIDDTRRKYSPPNQSTCSNAYSLDYLSFDSIPGVYYKPLPPLPNELEHLHSMTNIRLLSLPVPYTFTLPPLEPFPMAPTIPLPPTPIPLPPSPITPMPIDSTIILSDFIIPPFPPPPTPRLSLEASHFHNHVFQQHDHSPKENKLFTFKEKRRQNRAELSVHKERPRFEDVDDLEASVFVGIHMSNIQKSKEILSKFNKESTLSHLALERFKAAKEEYDRLSKSNLATLYI